ncbi:MULTISPECIES: SDR family oxidoreductase [unclassified Myroides]|uniref:SDR family oxidoreductase n=1 Tax=unclassified Myroides TaxID=2642485 RepID=UPI001C71D78A|nr:MULTISPECIES: SDR family oxidoreductase [unclassified Myroides]
MRFENKVVFITGAGGGIGRETALAFAREGASVVATDISEKANQETAKLIEDEGGKVLAVTVDVTDSKSIQEALNQTIAKYGKLDFAFNNAGVENKVEPLHEVDEEEFKRVVNIDLTGVFLCMKYQLPLLLKNGSGSIVNTASIAGVTGFTGGASYGAAKHGVIGLTKTAALDYAAKGIRVNAICPSVVETEMIKRYNKDGSMDALKANLPIGRFGRVEEIAAAVLWLCSDESEFIVGQSLILDGGQLAGF